MIRLFFCVVLLLIASSANAYTTIKPTTAKLINQSAYIVIATGEYSDGDYKLNVESSLKGKPEDVLYFQWEPDEYYRNHIAGTLSRIKYKQAYFKGKVRGLYFITRNKQSNYIYELRKIDEINYVINTQKLLGDMTKIYSDTYIRKAFPINCNHHAHYDFLNYIKDYYGGDSPPIHNGSSADYDYIVEYLSENIQNIKNRKEKSLRTLALLKYVPLKEHLLYVFENEGRWIKSNAGYVLIDRPEVFSSSEYCNLFEDERVARIINKIGNAYSKTNDK